MSTTATPPGSPNARRMRSSPRKRAAESEDDEPQKANANGKDDGSPSSKQAKAGKSGVKKESFKWNTPADEFADDVASDAEDEEGVIIGRDADSPIAAEIDGEQYEAHRTADGGIVIHLGVEEADRFAVDSSKGGKGGHDDSFEQYEKSAKRKLGEPKEKFQCPKCDKIWNWPWELRRHVLTHYKEKEREQTSTYKCAECNRGFQWKRDLAQHARLHTGEKLLVCSVCEKKFTTRQALLHHVVVHTGEKPFQCAMCGNRFTQPANLRTHMKKKHGSLSMSGNKCPHCHEPFASIVAVHQHILEDHQSVVAEEREEQLLEKMKKEQMKAERERMREENRKKRMERRKERIDYNDFRGLGLQEWEINYEFHIGEGLVKGVDWDRTPSNGELVCEICDRKFGWRYEVMFHNLCHKTDENGKAKNKVCPECDTAFKVPIGLKHHLLLHTGEMPFLCLHCWRSFSAHIDLKLHIRKEHLQHMEPATPKADAAKKDAAASKAKAEATPKRRSIKISKGESHQQQVQQVTIVNQDGTPVSGENVQYMMANQESGGENQTILVNSDGTIVEAGDQDMIVVIQSEDFDQSQGLIVVDPDQLQHMVGVDGQPVTLVEASSGETMILSDGGAGKLPTTTTTTTTTIISDGQAESDKETKPKAE